MHIRYPLIFLPKALDCNDDLIDLHIVELDTNIALKDWDEEVQPVIDSLDKPRLDKNWSWVKNWQVAKRLTKASGQNLKVFATYVYNRKSRPVLFSIMIASTGYTHLNDKSKKSTFVWWLSKAPSQYLTQNLVDTKKLPKVIPINVDTAIIDSFRNRYDGRIGLHADSLGGQELMKKYRNAGLNNLPSNVSLPRLRKLQGFQNARGFSKLTQGADGSPHNFPSPALCVS
ncbi:hypothetical protein AB6E08_17395, partial [Vibrio sp. 10N.247.310.24]|uniref:hypothetical protein n=3 Tax=unclassified Vibrio TaxID=2614977 RepID=UPI003553F009